MFTLIGPLNPAHAAPDCIAHDENELRDAIINLSCTNILTETSTSAAGANKGILITSSLNVGGKIITASDGQYALMVDVAAGSAADITISNATIVGSSTANSQPPLNLIGNNGLQASNNVFNSVTFDTVTIQATNNWYAMSVADTDQIIFKDTKIDAKELFGYDKSDGNTLSFDFSGLTWTTKSPTLAFQLDPGLLGDLILGCVSTPASIQNAASSYMTDPAVGEPWSRFVKEAHVSYDCLNVHFNANAPKGTKAKGSMSDGLVDSSDVILTMPKSGFKVTGYKFLGWSYQATDTKPTITPGKTIDFSNYAGGNPYDMYAIWQKVATPCKTNCVNTGGSVVSGLPIGLGVVLLIGAAGVAFVTRRRWATN